jgi:hypothetical protein
MPDEKKKAPEATKADSASKLELLNEINLPSAVLAVDADETGNRLFAACLDGGVYEVNLGTKKVEQLAKHASFASGVHYLPKAGTVISAGYDGVLLWNDVAERKTFRKIQAHQFWSWQTDLSPDGKSIASATGQYLAGGYKYEPAPEREPSVKVFDAESGEMRWEFSHLPPVLSVVFSPDGKYLAAANMMGDIKVWDLASGKQAAAWNTPAFTSWGIIKSHHYIGGIFSLCFAPNSAELLACGMGPMNDPMAGNGKQTWQRFAWKENPPRQTAQIHDSDHGNGLMEAILFHPSKESFLMAGRLAQGKWNAAFFDSASGRLTHSIDSKMRVVDALFLQGGDQVLLAGAASQERKKDGKCPEFGHIKVYSCGDLGSGKAVAS